MIVKKKKKLKDHFYLLHFNIQEKKRVKNSFLLEKTLMKLQKFNFLRNMLCRHSIWCSLNFLNKTKRKRLKKRNEVFFVSFSFRHIFRVSRTIKIQTDREHTHTQRFPGRYLYILLFPETIKTKTVIHIYTWICRNRNIYTYITKPMYQTRILFVEEQVGLPVRLHQISMPAFYLSLSHSI